MKKRFSAVIILLVSLVILLTSCKLPFFNKNPGGTGDNDGTGNNSSDTMIYGEGVSTTVVIAQGSGIDTARIDEAIFNACGVVTILRDDTSETVKGEIVIGETTREVTSLANAALNKAIRSFVYDSDDEEFAWKDTVGYGVYAKDGALALVWKGEEAESMAYTYLIDNYLKASSLDSAEEISDFKVLSLTAYYEDMAQEQKDAEWARLKQDFIDFGCTESEAQSCVRAVQNFYSIADESVYLWIANLYDSGTGGFYYSNSGRDTEGFAPDIESTIQALNLLQNNGMFDDFGHDTAEKLQNGLPKDMQAKIVAFVQGCQSNVDGYFHHPQWEGMDSTWTSRLNRDLSWALGLLEYFGAEPLYDLPTDRVNSASALTGRLGFSSAKMVSKVVLAEGADLSFLESIEAFEAYLKSFDWETESYQAGSTTGTLTAQISARGPEYVALYESFLNERQKDKNGLWEDDVCYASVNGLMKITAAFNSLGIELQYADKAFASAIQMAKHEGADSEGFQASHIVDVYNPWYVMRDILKNVQMHGDYEMAQKLRSSLISEAVSLIECSMLKTTPFKKNDGSFGYNWDYSPEKSSGAPVAVPGTVEGDVNGCVMSFGVLGNLLDTFGIESVRRYYITDYRAFIAEIESLGPVVKTNNGVPAEPITFDEYEIDTNEIDDFESLTTNGGVGKVEYKEGSTTDKVFHLTDVSTSQGTSIRVTPGGVPVGASRCVAEFDINVKEAKGDIFYQIFFGSTYQLTLKNDGDNVRIGDSSTKGVNNDFGVTFKKGEWHRIRVEYYFTGDPDTTITKIFLDGYLRAESNNFYGKLPEGGGKPDLVYHQLHFYTLFDPTVNVYFDNIFAEKDQVIYKSEPIVNPFRVNDFESQSGKELPSGMTAAVFGKDSTYGIVDNPRPSNTSNAQGNAFRLNTPTGNASFRRNIESLTKNGNTFVFEADVYVDSASDNGLVSEMFINSADGKIFSLAFTGGREARGQYLELSVLNNNGNVNGSLARVFVDKWVNLRIEYYRCQYEMAEDGVLWKGVKVRVLLDGKEVFNGLCEYPEPNNLSKQAIDFYFNVPTGKALDIYIDNLIFETADIVYVDENGTEVPDPEKPLFPSGSPAIDTPAAEDHDGIFDFEDIPTGDVIVPGITTKPNTAEYGNYITVADDPEGNRALHFVTIPSSNIGNTIRFASSKLSPEDANCQITEFSVRCDSIDGEENFLQLYMYDPKSNLITSYNILMPIAKNGNIEISTRYSSSVSGTGINTKIPFTDGYIKFRFEYYQDLGIAKLYVNDAFIAEGQCGYNGTSGSGKLSVFRIDTLRRSDFDLYIDNVSVKSIVKQYTQEN